MEFVTSDKTKKRGVILYIRPKLKPKLLFKDEQGMIVAVQTIMHGKKIAIVGIYAPRGKI